LIHNKQYKVTKQLIEFIFEESEGFLSSGELDELFSRIEMEANKYYFTDSSESNLIRIIGAQYDSPTFLKELLKYPLHIEVLIAIAANSNYLTDIAVRNPQYLYLIFNPSFLSRRIQYNEIDEEIKNGVKNYKTYDSKVNFLKLLKRRYILKIGISDILGEFDLKEITRQLSILANAITANLFSISLSEILQRYNTDKTINNYCLASLGKLGGNELNYSSDIDLILFYDENKSEIPEFEEILTKATELFIKSSTERTDKGYLYRVDFRLRPEGKNSPLYGTLGDYIRYYESRGEDWERQMLIKLSFTAGNQELFNKFQDYIEHYVYPASFSASPLYQIQRIKSQIEKTLKKETNIKLTVGGIRDIEFSVQALQLVNGGKIQELREVNTLNAIEKLEANELLSREEASVMRDAYMFYRKIEHYLQLMNDTQTHEIPANQESAAKLAVFLGFQNREDFKRELSNKKSQIKMIYNSIVNTEGEETDNKNPFDEISFQNKSRAAKNFQFLTNGSGLLEQKAFDTKTIRLFKEIEPALVQYLNGSIAPDKVLDNFVKVIKKIKLVSILYQEFTNTPFFNSFLYLCEYSDKAINLISSDKTNLELLLTRKAFQKDLESIYEEISLMNMLFILSVQFTLGLLEYSEISAHISNFTTMLINRYLKGIDLGASYFIGALGSFGSKEMNFASDIDIILVFDQITNYEKTQKAAQRLNTELNKLLTPFEVDFRLRPEGRSSQLAWDINKYEEYLSERAQVWEFQALTKLRLVYGNKNLYKRFIKAVLKNSQELSEDRVKKSMTDMIKKIRQQKASTLGTSIDIKTSRGGLVEIQFLTQYLILFNKQRESESLTGENTEVTLKKLSGTYGELEKLIECYNLLRQIEMANQNLFDTKKTKLPNNKEQQLMLAKFLNCQDFKTLEKTLIDYLKLSKQLFDAFMRG
jgi:glutamate-ammonia-ligase adenylyltransferase